MSLEALIGSTQRLNVSVEALAALAAHLHILTEQLEPDPEVAALLRTVVSNLGLDLAQIESIPTPQLESALGAARSFLRQAQDLIDAPDRPPGWTYDDPTVLQAQGRASFFAAGLIARAAPTLGDLDDRLRADGARFLDVGTGVGLLATAICETFPTLRVTGIDTWPPALDLARRNVDDAGFADRVELREQSVTDLADVDAFAAAWVPAPFLPQRIMEATLDRTRTALHSGGWAVLGLYAAPPEPLPQALTALRTVRGGGHPWTPEEAIELLDRAGFTDVRDIERTSAVPIKLVAGCAT